MKHHNIFCFKNKLAFNLLLIILLADLSIASAQPVVKKVSPWYVYKEGSSFGDLKPYKDMISSISVFGNPSKQFIGECHKNGILVYHGVSGSEKDIDTPETP
jgi:hypothetical protein